MKTAAAARSGCAHRNIGVSPRAQRPRGEDARASRQVVSPESTGTLHDGAGRADGHRLMTTTVGERRRGGGRWQAV